MDVRKQLDGVFWWFCKDILRDIPLDPLETDIMHLKLQLERYYRSLQ